MKSSTKIRQRDVTDCGAACLASVSAHYQLKIPIARIRQYASTDQKGTNVLGLIQGAERLGFQAKGVKGNLDSLQKIPKPSIAHIKIFKEGNSTEHLLHYVVIYKVSEKHIWYMDPGDGKIHKKLLSDFEEVWTGILVLLLPQQEFKTGSQKVSVFRRFVFLLNPHKFVLLQALFGAVIYTILGLATAIYIQKITDHVIVEGNQNLLNLLSLSMIVLLLVQIFIGTIKSIFAFKTGQQIDAQLILGYYKHLMKLPQRFFDTMRVGEITSRISDAVKIRLFINDIAINLIVNVFVIIFSFALMFTYYWKLALIMLVILPLYAIIYVIANQINKRLQRKLMENAADLETQLVESLNAMATIKRFGLEGYANLKTENRFVRLLKTTYSAGINNLYIGTTGDFTSKLFTVLILWTGTYFVLQNELTPGELLSFYALIGYFTGPALSLIGANKSIQDALIAADRLFEIMDLEQESEDNKVNLTPELVGNIEFRGVTFHYGSRAKVFENLNLTIDKGKVNAIVGESGSGKSTLLSLLQNLYPLSSGNILIGNLDIQHISNESLRTLVGVVPQQIDLFAGTIIENIAIGDFEPDMQLILNISQSLGINDFIKTMPQGFNTMLGERGVNLSGGQRQRLAIARALYRKPEILILDEITSALDSISEQYVQNTLQMLRQQGKTIIIIAHRLSTIQNADKIIVLFEGKVSEEGIHKELLGNKKLYYNLWKQQFEPQSLYSYS